MTAVFSREFKAYFTSPIGYFVLAILFLFSGVFFYDYSLQYNSPDLSGVYSNLFSIVLLAVLPILTMRLFSEDKRQKTDQALLTAPVSLTGIVMGKFMAAVVLFAIGISITFVYAIIIAMCNVTPDWMAIIGNYLGLLLMSAAVIAIGVLISSLTESMFVAAIGTFGVTFALVMVDNLTTIFADSELMASIVNFLSLSRRYSNFTMGLINYNDVIFFLSIQALFLFLTVRLLDRKRWS